MQRDNGSYVLETEQRLPRSLEDVFAFFADPFNLEHITPPRLRFRVLTPPPVTMRAGLLIDYRLSLHGIPFRWQSEISAWDPPHRFVDEQRRGPYRTWFHEHRFEARGDETIVTDAVRYQVPGGRLAHGLLVARDLRAIFEYRTRTLSERLGSGG
jgi:ligand-binding SRPBCC domain-containing protein